MPAPNLVSYQLSIRDLRVSFGGVEVVRGVDLGLLPGETLGVVGESGCGKSMTGQAIMGMVPKPGKVSGSIRLADQELIGLSEKDWRRIRGERIAIVMQDPFASLNPLMRVGEQIAESIHYHQDLPWPEARRQAVEMLHKVGVPEPEFSARKYPHEMSGGQRQRIVIACAFACRPEVLIADEPTTALDVTLQAQILDLLATMQRETGTSVLLISHDIGVVSQRCERIAVFYAGQVVETGETKTILAKPRHPYTRALLRAMPRPGVSRLESIKGQPPRFAELGAGCAFADRCPNRVEICDQPPSLDEGVRCWRRDDPGLV